MNKLMKRNYTWPALITGGTLLLLPLVAFAQLEQTDTITDNAIRILNRIVQITILIAFLFFAWGIAQFIRGADEPATRAAGRMKMIWGVIALAVLVSIWGLVWWLQLEFNISNQDAGDFNVNNIYRIEPNP